MRAAMIVLLVAACGDDGANPLPAFSDEGGVLEVPGCGYSVTTRTGAEPPRLATNFAGPDPTPRHVHLGLMTDPKTSIVAQWRTVDDTTRATTMRYGVGANLSESELTQTVEGIEFAYASLGSEYPRIHQVHLCDLTPGTAYSYQVGSPGYYSPVYTFRTAPDVVANPDAEVVIGFVGDSRGGYDIWSQLVGLLQQRMPDLMLYSGDAVTIGISQDEWEPFLERGEPLFARAPIVIAHGNHEVNAINFYSQFAMPGDQETFGFDYGHAHITVANDTPVAFSEIGGKIRDAIQADFAASTNARWKMLMHHQPMWSASNHGSNLTLQAMWGPLVDQHAIDLVLNGHEHEYEVTKPLRGGEVQASNADGTVYVIAGGAGAPQYANGTDFWTEYSEQTYGASVIRVRRDQMVLEAFRQDDTAIPVGFSKTKP